MELLERTLQLQALNTALNQVLAGNGQGCIALVYGEAGIGKTALVDHFIQLNKKSCRVLQGVCDSLFTPRPLGPLHDIAFQVKGNLLALFDSDANRETIFFACLNELTVKPTITIFEDVHWADEATLDLLKYLGRRTRQTKSLIILTYRDDELGIDHPLRLLLGDLASSYALHRIPLAPLSKEAVHELAKNKDIDSGMLYRLTNGNPFFVTEVLAAESGIPTTVRDAVLARAARLSHPARAVLEIAAVIGSRVEPWLLSKISDAEIATVEECISKGILQVQGDYYAFRHELARQIILDSISSHKKFALHRKTLEALKESAITRDNLARLAHHAEAINDPQAVLEFAPLAAWWASELGAHREAVAFYKTALKYANALSAEKRAELLDAYVDECSLLDQRTDAKQAQVEALHIWQKLGRREREGRSYRRLAEIDHDFTLSSEREQNALRAIKVLETLPPSIELARAYSHMARLHLNLNAATGKDPMYWGSRAMELAEQFGDVETLAHALSSIGTWQMHTHQRAAGQAKVERSLQLSLEHDLQFHAARAFANLANELTAARDYESALHYVEKGIDYCMQHDLDFWHIGFLINRAQIRFQTGYWEEAEQDTQTILRLRTHHDSLDFMMITLIILQLQMRSGIPFSPEILKSVYESLPKIQDLDGKCFYAALFAESAWLKSDLVQCRAEAEPIYQIVAPYHEQPADSNYFGFSELSYWMWRAGAITEPQAGVMEPYASHIKGNWQAAATMWENYGCPYELGMALMDGDEAAQLTALEIFERLGARPILDILRQKMRTQGRRIPRGPRPSTRENRFGLTAREMEVLTCLAKGSSNNTIAQELSLSARTVEHHIASILQKMGVQSRNEAVAKALKENLLASE